MECRRRFARLGYNTIRIHHHDGDWFASDGNKDRLDYLIARAIEKMSDPVVVAA